MYEKPVLVRVGAAEEVIQGAIGLGSDLDGTWAGSGGPEFAEDPNCEDNQPYPL
jgi:hypothetical protein